MANVPLVLVSIIAFESMEDSIGASLLAMGATGYNAWTVRGRGVHGVRPSTWAGSNVRIETAVTQEVAEKIVTHLHHSIGPDVALKIMTTPVVLHER